MFFRFVEIVYISLYITVRNWIHEIDNVGQSPNDFFKPTFLPNNGQTIQLYHYETSDRLVFLRFLEEIEDTKKTFRN